ncbi:MAG: lipoprotein-releasing ABC transporter permease subunit [Magnetococcus sp. WYHC-3]
MWPYEWLIGLRYLRARKSQGFISLITFLTLGGIALGVAALIVVLAVMTGFKEELQRQILGVTSHVVVQSFSGSLADDPVLLERLRQHEGVKGAAPYVVAQSLFSANGVNLGVVVRGVAVHNGRTLSGLEQHVVEGDLGRLPDYGVALGRGLAANLGLDVGDPVTVLAPQTSVTALGTLPRVKRFRVAAVFDTGMHEYDHTLAYMHLQDAQTLFRLKGRLSGIELHGETPDQSLILAQQLREVLGDQYWVRDWMDMNRNFFRALKMEKATMFVILFLVVLVAAFNIISSLIMVVMEKRRDIAILKTMGATSGGIMKIFMINGGIVGLGGTLSGAGLGLLLAFNLEGFIALVERVFGVQILSGDVYFIDHLPSEVLPEDFALVVGISLLISLTATLYPARRAARVDPVETLRHE